MAKSTVMKWKAITTKLMEIDLRTLSSREIMPVEDGSYPGLDKSGSKHLLQCMIYMPGDPQFLADVFCKASLNIANGLSLRLQSENIKQDEGTSLQNEISKLSKFRVIPHCSSNFMRCSNSSTCRGVGEVVEFSELILESKRATFGLSLFKRDIGGLWNTDEVALPYWYFPRRPILDFVTPSNQTQHVDCLPVVLTIYKNPRKAPLAINGLSKHPRTSPRLFDQLRNLSVIYKH